MEYKVVELFDSLEGEGLRTGQPATFVRLAGCNLRCTYCDTLYALFGEAEPCRYKIMTAEEILARTNPRFRRVTLTGGEPLAAPGAAELCSLLAKNGYAVNIETNGAVDILAFSNACTSMDNMFFTIDYKLPSSGMEDKMIWRNFESLRPQDVLKFVVGSEADAVRMTEIMGRLKKIWAEPPHIFAGAVYGQYDLQRLAALILSDPACANIHVQVQLHKIIWSPDERGV